MPEKQPILYMGTSGLVLKEPNKLAFPEEHRHKSRLAYYATLLNSIEINSSFYKIPLPATFTKWSNMVPAHFRFTLKLWRGITHNKGLEFDNAAVDEFMKAAACLGTKKGCLLIQLPPAITSARLTNLDKLLDRIWRANDTPAWQLAVEFRHRSWYAQPAFSLLQRYKAALVLHDMPSSGIKEPPLEGNFVYLRFHGVRGDYKGSYPAGLLHQYALDIDGWIKNGKDVYAYFNNTIGDAVANLHDLAAMVNTLPHAQNQTGVSST